ncbi:MAG: hypothetical protein HY851_03540, partial [candidate division Zixibacteria bacterium]|nr:hypothetical protein [candidate division Zixibacteria bacterium]
QEIDRMLAPMLESARLFNRRFGTTAVVAGVAGAYDYETELRRRDNAGITIQYDNSRSVIADSDLVVTASGTATLETGIIGRPMVIVYKTGWITYQIARRLVKLDTIGLANLVLGEKVVPELIQNQASPENISAELANYRDHQERYLTVREKLLTIPQRLGGIGASDRAAELIGRYL